MLFLLRTVLAAVAEATISAAERQEAARWLASVLRELAAGAAAV